MGRSFPFSALPLERSEGLRASAHALRMTGPVLMVKNHHRATTPEMIWYPWYFIKVHHRAHGVEWVIWLYHPTSLEAMNRPFTTYEKTSTYPLPDPLCHSVTISQKPQKIQGSFSPQNPY